MTQVNRNDHPELKEGEEFYCNVASKKIFEEMSFKTKRIGKVAYSEPGREIKPLTEGGGPFPVFVQKKELEEYNTKQKIRL